MHYFGGLAAIKDEQNVGNSTKAMKRYGQLPKLDSKPSNLDM